MSRVAAFGMPLQHAKILSQDGAIIPQIHRTLCSPACVFYVWCLNFNANNPCKGFRLAENGEAKKTILRNLKENDKIYVERCIQRINESDDVEERLTLVPDILRFLPPKPQTPPMGFRAMLDNVVSRSTEAPNYIEQYHKQIFPQVCSADCKYTQCPYHRNENYGKLCFKQFEQFKTVPRGWIK